MKMTINKVLSVLLVLCLILSLAACGANNAASGLGSLTMDGSGSDDPGDGPDDDPGDIGTLGEPSPTSDPGGDPDPSDPEPVPLDGYIPFSSKEQDFSFLFDAGYSAEWSDENGATVYTETYDSIPFIMVFSLHRGDTTGFDVSNYFYFEVEDTKAMLGSSLIEVKTDLTLPVDGKNLPGVLYTYKVGEYTVEMFRVLNVTADSVMLYSAKYIQGKGDPTIQAMEKAISTTQLDADYYSNGGGTGTNTPEETPKQDTLSTELYKCDQFTITKPVGWEVFYEVIDAGGGIKRLTTFVYNPANPNDTYFFVTALEPFYTSESAKREWLPYCPAYYGAAPVISGDPTAEATLKNWSGIFSMLTAEGFDTVNYLRDYGLTQVMESKVINSSASGGTNSYVLGMVTIPGAREQSLMFFQNNLVLMDGVSPIPTSARYYISYSNLGVVVSESAAISQYDTLFSCLQTFDPSGFLNQNSVTGGITGGELVDPQFDVSTLN